MYTLADLTYSVGQWSSPFQSLMFRLSYVHLYMFSVFYLATCLIFVHREGRWGETAVLVLLRVRAKGLGLTLTLTP